MKDEVLVSELMFQKQELTASEIMKALLDGHKIKRVNAPKGCNYYLKGGQLKSEKITYLKGIPQTWFNPDIRYEIDYD